MPLRTKHLEILDFYVDLFDVVTLMPKKKFTLWRWPVLKYCCYL